MRVWLLLTPLLLRAAVRAHMVQGGRSSGRGRLGRDVFGAGRPVRSPPQHKSLQAQQGQRPQCRGHVVPDPSSLKSRALPMNYHASVRAGEADKCCSCSPAFGHCRYGDEHPVTGCGGLNRSCAEDCPGGEDEFPWKRIYGVSRAGERALHDACGSGRSAALAWAPATAFATTSPQATNPEGADRNGPQVSARGHGGTGRATGETKARQGEPPALRFACALTGSGRALVGTYHSWVTNVVEASSSSGSSGGGSRGGGSSGGSGGSGSAMPGGTVDLFFHVWTGDEGYDANNFDRGARLSVASDHTSSSRQGGRSGASSSSLLSSSPSALVAAAAKALALSSLHTVRTRLGCGGGKPQ